MNENNVNNNLNNNENINIKPIMYKNENDMSQITLRRILYAVILILVIVIIILLFKKRPIVSTTKEQELQTKLDNYKTVLVEFGKESYYKARDVYGDIVLDTERICGSLDPNTLVDNYYMKATNSKFLTYPALKEYIGNYFYGNIINSIITVNRFKNYGGSLYCIAQDRSKNNRYIGVESIELSSFELDKLEYNVKEKYFADNESLDCLDNCQYEIKENKFVLEKKDNRWLVVEFILPY